MNRLIRIAHLYPQEMNIYGDLGNVTTLVKRLEWRDYAVEVVPVQIGEAFDFTAVDLVFGGGGQDQGQVLVGADLRARAAALRAAAADGLPMLLVCGLYQLFGHGFTPAGGHEIEGIGIFDARTVAGPTRLIGNVVVESSYGRLVGFENHSGVTTLGSEQAPLGRVISGNGNGAAQKRRQTRFEGAVTGNVIGTYMHGSLLPKNPVLADHLIGLAVGRRYGVSNLAPLDDTIEHDAATVAGKLKP